MVIVFVRWWRMKEGEEAETAAEDWMAKYKLILGCFYRRALAFRLYLLSIFFLARERSFYWSINTHAVYTQPEGICCCPPNPLYFIAVNIFSNIFSFSFLFGTEPISEFKRSHFVWMVGHVPMKPAWYSTETFPYSSSTSSFCYSLRAIVPNHLMHLISVFQHMGWSLNRHGLVRTLFTRPKARIKCVIRKIKACQKGIENLSLIMKNLNIHYSTQKAIAWCFFSALPFRFN